MWHRLFRRGKPLSAPQCDARRLKSRPSLEALEDRLALSTFVVNSIGDTGQGSGLSGDLRYAITQADAMGGANTITFDSSVFSTPQTITLQNSLPDITDDRLSIQGPGSNLATISGNHAFRVFNIPAQDATVSGLTVANGSVQGDGGGINFTGLGTLTVRNCVLSGNADVAASAAGGFGAGLCNGSASVKGAGTVEVSNSTVSNNVNTVPSPYFGGGGGIANFGTLTLTDSTVSGNSGGSGAGISSSRYTALTLTRTTVSGNSATGFESGGGGIDCSGNFTMTSSTVSGNSAYDGGGLVLEGVTSNLVNSTLFGNSATDWGGGLYTQGKLTITMNNVTVAGNSATSSGGGLYLRPYYGTPNVTLNNTIDATNTAGQRPDGSGTLARTSGYNLIGVGNGLGGISNGVNGNQIGTAGHPLNPQLTSLGHYGGPTETLNLKKSSPAINAGSNALAVDQNGNPLTTDQRGKTRIVGGTVDIGAVEFQSPPGPNSVSPAPVLGIVSLAQSPSQDEASTARNGDQRQAVLAVDCLLARTDHGLSLASIAWGQGTRETGRLIHPAAPPLFTDLALAQ